MRLYVIDMADMLKQILDDGGAFCIHCGDTFTSVREARKHDLAEHYDYCLLQNNGDKEQLKQWANLP